jgi:hypothetical protein
LRARSFILSTVHPIVVALRKSDSRDELFISIQFYFNSPLFQFLEPPGALLPFGLTTKPLRAVTARDTQSLPPSTKQTASLFHSPMRLNAVDQLWVADITYIRLQAEFVYLIDDSLAMAVGLSSAAMGSMKSAWTTCRKAAGVWCRLHDLRHTFISGLAEAGVLESTMKAIAGWMSAMMLERYSHTRAKAKREAVNKLPRRRPAGFPKIPHSRCVYRRPYLVKLLILNGRRGGDRTHNPRLRRPVLYPIELLAHVLSL